MLTLGEKLKDLRLERGFKNTADLAEIINIPKSTLNNYENDNLNHDVGYANLVILAKFYDVSLDWLLGVSSVDKHLNTAYSDLGLSDKAIDTIKSEYFNSRLLSEIIEHEIFTDLMVVIQIYIDNIITAQINSINIMMHRSRDILLGIGKYVDRSYFMKSLEEAKIDEERYFRSVIHERIDLITSDIRKTYVKNKKDFSVSKENNKLLNGVSDKVSQVQFDKINNAAGFMSYIFKGFTDILGRKNGKNLK